MRRVTGYNVVYHHPNFPGRMQYEIPVAGAQVLAFISFVTARNTGYYFLHWVELNNWYKSSCPRKKHNGLSQDSNTGPTGWELNDPPPEQ